MRVSFAVCLVSAVKRVPAHVFTYLALHMKSSCQVLFLAAKSISDFEDEKSAFDLETFKKSWYHP